MPEQLTRHPDVTLQVLRSAGAKCGEGAPQTILTQCPRERFCALPGGEICIYGLEDAARMTQIRASDWRALQRPASADDAPADAGAWPLLLTAGAALLLGLVLGAALVRLHQARRARR